MYDHLLTIEYVYEWRKQAGRNERRKCYYNSYYILLVSFARSVRQVMDLRFFPSLFSWPARFALGPLKEGKISVHSLPYGPRTRLIRGMYCIDIVLYCTALYCIALFGIVLYCIVLYYIILH